MKRKNVKEGVLVKIKDVHATHWSGSTLLDQYGAMDCSTHVVYKITLDDVDYGGDVRVKNPETGCILYVNKANLRKVK